MVSSDGGRLKIFSISDLINDITQYSTGESILWIEYISKDNLAGVTISGQNQILVSFTTINLILLVMKFK